MTGLVCSGRWRSWRGRKVGRRRSWGYIRSGGRGIRVKQSGPYAIRVIFSTLRGVCENLMRSLNRLKFGDVFSFPSRITIGVVFERYMRFYQYFTLTP